MDPYYSVNLKIQDKNGRLVFSRGAENESAYHSFPFTENLPKLNLLLNESQPGFVSSLLTAGSGIYLVVFILIIFLMALGFIFTIYTINEELRLNKLKSEFISNVSHELKSPLTSIRMMTEMLHSKRVSSEERKSEYYSVMLEETEHLSHLIDNILDFSRLEDERKKYHYEDQDLIDLLEKFLDSVGERLKEGGFMVRFDHSGQVPFISADKDALHQVFYNLVDNAIKYSGNSRQVDISLVVRDEEVLVSVKDYGIGISRSDQEKIFERFYRSEDPQTKDVKGSGIGLTIVKKIVEAHRGHLTLESRPGKGSTFCIHLPISNNKEQ